MEMISIAAVVLVLCAAISNGEDCTEQRIDSCFRSIAIRSPSSETVSFNDNDICRNTEMQLACLEEMETVCGGMMDAVTLGILNTHIYNGVDAMRLASCNEENDTNVIGVDDDERCMVKDSLACAQTMYAAAERASQLPPSLRRKNESCRAMVEGSECVVAAIRNCLKDQLVRDLVLELVDVGSLTEQTTVKCSDENYTGYENVPLNLYNLPMTVNGEDCSINRFITSFTDLRDLGAEEPEVNTLQEWDSYCRKLKKGTSAVKTLITVCLRDPFQQAFYLKRLNFEQVTNICRDEPVYTSTSEITLDQWTAPAVGNEACTENGFLMCIAPVYDYQNMDTTAASLKDAHDICRVLKEGISCLKRKLRMCMNNPQIEQKILELSGIFDFTKNISHFCSLEDDQPDGKKCAFYMRMEMDKKCLTDIKTESDNFKICCSKYEILECVNKTTAGKCGTEGAQLAIDMTTRIYWPPEKQCDEIDKMSCSSDTTRPKYQFMIILEN